MAFVKKEWKGRIVEFPGRRRLKGTGITDVYDIARNEGTITQEGDAFSAVNMNDLEERIEGGLLEKVNKSDALQTLEQISANTDSNKIAGAAALKELNNNMSQSHTSALALSSGINPTSSNSAIKNSKTVQIDLSFQISRTFSSGNVLFTIPVDYRPRNLIFAQVFDMNSYISPVTVQISTDGRVIIVAGSIPVASTVYSIHIAYLV